MNVSTFVTGATINGVYPATGLQVLQPNNDFRNTNNTGILQCYQSSPGAGATSIVAVAFSVQGSFDGVTWGLLLATTTATAPTTTADGGIWKSISLAPYMRISITTPPSATGGAAAPTTASFTIGW